MSPDSVNQDSTNPSASDKDRVIIFDTTMRDGEQSPGASMNLEEKLRIAEILEDMRVDVIEAGFAIASEGDFEAITEISKIIRECTICSLSRSSRGDIERSAEALKHAERKRIHTVIAVSPIHMEMKLQMTPEEVHAAVIDSVTHARNFSDDVEWSAEDATRAERDFLFKCVESAIKAGATTVNIPDTVGYTVPSEYRALVADMMNSIPNIDKARISVHCHNDLGLAVANSLAALDAGARQIECTINGLGERAGNCSLEEIVMALKTRPDAMPYVTNVETRHIMKASRMVSTVTGFAVQPNKAIVGANAFAHEAGIHQDGMLKDRNTYEIMRPEDVGVIESTLVMGKHSGRHAFRVKLKELGYELGQNALNDTFRRFKALADQKKDVFDEDIIALVDDEVVREHERVQFVSLRVVAGSEGPQQASLQLDIDGEIKGAEATGNGPVDAIFNGIKELFPHEATLQLYQVHAVTHGTDAQAEVTVRLEEDGKTVNGQGADPDTMVASARAYVHALNKLLTKREKTAPASLSA